MTVAESEVVEAEIEHIMTDGLTALDRSQDVAYQASRLIANLRYAGLHISIDENTVALKKVGFAQALQFERNLQEADIDYKKDLGTFLANRRGYRFEVEAFTVIFWEGDTRPYLHTRAVELNSDDWFVLKILSSIVSKD